MTCDHDATVTGCDPSFGISADGKQCLPGVSNCAVINALSVAVCDQCNTPIYYWDGIDCIDCTVGLDVNCLAVTHLGVITNCGGGEFPAVDGLTCEPPAADCATVNVNPVICDDCNPNFWWDGTTCVACSVIDADCSTCNHTECLTCTTVGNIPDFDGLSCVVEPLNCLVLDPLDFSLCDLCDVGFVENTTDS